MQGRDVLCGFHQKEWMEEKELPIKYVALGTSFGNVDEILSIMQNQIIEQFVITAPEQSWEMHEEMLKAAEEFYQSVLLI